MKNRSSPAFISRTSTFTPRWHCPKQLCQESVTFFADATLESSACSSRCTAADPRWSPHVGPRQTRTSVRGGFIPSTMPAWLLLANDRRRRRLRRFGQRRLRLYAAVEDVADVRRQRGQRARL